jgi:acetyltransferase-like isoleucine patch superfamily enzyme
MRKVLTYLFVVMNYVVIICLSAVPAALAAYYYLVYVYDGSLSAFLLGIPVLWFCLYSIGFMNIVLPVVFRRTLYFWFGMKGFVKKARIGKGRAYSKWLFLNSLYSYAMVWRYMLPFLDLLTVFILRGFKARIGKNVIITRADIFDPWFISIGKNTVLGHNVLVSSHYFEDDLIKWGRINIGSDCTIGTRSIISPGAKIGRHCIIGAKSFVEKDQAIPPNHVYAGTPAKKIRKLASS